jgi:putative acetyltransferase
MPKTDLLEIRPLELADVPALLEIIADSRRENGSGEESSALLEPADHALYANYHRQRTLYFVALLGGEVVGGAGVAPLAASDPLTCELQRMYLRADARGRGIGDALLERCLAAARQFLYVRCYLEAGAQAQAAREFYGRHGFRDLQASHNDRWLIRTLRASAREGLRSSAAY